MDPTGIRYETPRFSSLAVDSGGEIVAASAKGAPVFVADPEGMWKVNWWGRCSNNMVIILSNSLTTC